MRSSATQAKSAHPKRRVRTISNLTQEQLSHKRDVDRKAQRALRQRTKTRIQELEEEIFQLRGSLEERNAIWEQELLDLRQKNEWLEDRLRRIGNLADSSTFPETHEEILEEASDSAAESDASDCISVHVRSEDSPNLANQEELAGSTHTADESGQRRAPTLRNPIQHRSTSVSDAITNTIEGELAIGDDSNVQSVPTVDATQFVVGDAPDAYGSSFPMPASPMYAGNFNRPRTNPISEFQGSPSSTLGISRDVYLDGGSSALTSESMPSAISPQSSTRSNHQPQLRNPGQSSTVSSALCSHSSPSCPLDSILLDFLSSRRMMASSGVSTGTLLGPDRPSMTAMLYPDRAATEHPVNRVMAEVLNTFPHVKLPEKLAFMYLMHSTMRWQISPTKEYYERLPHWLRPTATQITTAHAAWIDNIPWPRVRDMLIQYPEKYPFATFSELYSHNVSVNWPYDDTDALQTVLQDGVNAASLSHIFEKHIQRLNNWTVAKDFEDALPEMAMAVHSRD